MLLASQGCKVKIYERLAHVGGRTSTIEAEGFKFDLSDFSFSLPSRLEEIFRACGRELANEVELIRLDPQYRIAFSSGGKIDATPDVDADGGQIARLCPEDAPNFRRFLDDNRAKLTGFQPILQRAFHGLRDLSISTCCGCCR
jgi:phytoene desaturase